LLQSADKKMALIISNIGWLEVFIILIIVAAILGLVREHRRNI
jgi:hypothetical protein